MKATTKQQEKESVNSARAGEALQAMPAESSDQVRQDHQHSAIYAANHVHSAVHHVKPRHNTRIEL